jgi:hypothetical protein
MMVEKGEEAEGRGKAGGGGRKTREKPGGEGSRRPPIHNMGLCSRPGEDPNAWKQFGPEYCPGNQPGQ